MSEETHDVMCDSPRIDQATAERTRLLPLFAAWLRPAAWAPRVDRVSLRLAFLIHLLAGLGTLLAFLCIEPFSDWLRDSNYSMLHGLTRSVLGLVWVFEHHTTAALLIAAGTVVTIEVGCIILALLVMPWEAADEPLRRSFAHALRRVWLHTTQAVPLFVLGGAPIAYMECLRHLFFTSPRYAALGGNWMAWPWWVRNDEMIIGYVAVVASAWFLWALFRAAGVPRQGSAPARPPTCEYCGYNLTGTPISGRCPECGVPATMSLGPDVRSGTACDRAAKGGFAVRQRCWLDAILRPKTIGRQIQVTRSSRRYRRCLTAVFVPAFAVCTVGFFLVVFALERGRVDANEVIEVLSEVPFVAIGVPAGTFVLAMLIAGAVGTFLSIREKRNLLPAAMQMQCYLGGLLLAWLAFGWLWATLTISLDNARLFRDLGRGLRMHPDIVGFFFWVLPTAGLLFLDGILVWKGTSAARYANR